MELIVIIAIAYLVLSWGVTAHLMGRGHSPNKVFAACIFCTPLIAAIMYSAPRR